MNLEEARRAAVEQRLQRVLVVRSRDLLKAIGLAVAATLLVLLSLQSPDEWAKGEFFRAGGWGHDHLGTAGAVLLVRSGVFVGAFASWLWLLRILRDLTWGKGALRARLAAHLEVLGGPPRPQA
jgi:hypothetical protein